MRVWLFKTKFAFLRDVYQCRDGRVPFGGLRRPLDRRRTNAESSSGGCGGGGRGRNDGGDGGCGGRGGGGRGGRGTGTGTGDGGGGNRCRTTPGN